MSHKIEKASVLVVKGNDDERFFGALLRHMGIAADVQIMKVGGITQLRKEIQTLSRVTGFRMVRSLGIVVDADTNSQAAFQRVQDTLRNADLPVPGQMLTPEGQRPSVRVLILPGSHDAEGALEDLCLRAVRNDPAMTCVENFFDCLESVSCRPRHSAKAKVQVFLASRERVYLRVGEAADKGYWPWDAPEFDEIRRFLQSLVDDHA
nr:DUF3226 domain-containing protein [Ardenticatena sp.]